MSKETEYNDVGCNVPPDYLPPPRIYFGGVTLGVVSLFVVRKSKTISQIKPHTYITGKNGWGF